MSNENNVAAGTAGPASQSGPSGVGQTASVGRSTSFGGGAAKVFREFRWGLLALFLLMAVVIGLVYDGGRKKKGAQAENNPKSDGRNPETLLDSGPEPGTPPVAIAPGGPNTGTLSPTGQTPTPARGGPPIIIDTQPPPIPTTPTRPTENRGGIDTHLGASPKPEGKLPAPPGSAKTYTVVAGDTLTSIASAHLPGKGGVKAILDANKDVLTNPNKVRIGMTLKIPAAAQAPEATPRSQGHDSDSPTAGNRPMTSEGSAPGPKAEGSSEYVVQNGDTLERIARKLFNDGRKWRDLFDWNRDQLSDPGHLRSGQVLKIKTASSHTTVSLPAPGAPRAAAEEGPQPVGQAPVGGAERHGGETQVMSASSSASLP